MRWLGVHLQSLILGNPTRLSSKGITSDKIYEYSHGTDKLKIKWNFHVDPNNVCV